MASRPRAAGQGAQPQRRDLLNSREHRRHCHPPPPWPRTRARRNLRQALRQALKLPLSSQSLQLVNHTLLSTDFPFPLLCILTDELTSHNLMLDSDSGAALVPAKNRSHRRLNACYSESLKREVRCLEDKILKGVEFG